MELRGGGFCSFAKVWDLMTEELGVLRVVCFRITAEALTDTRMMNRTAKVLSVFSLLVGVLFVKEDVLCSKLTYLPFSQKKKRNWTLKGK